MFNHCKCCGGGRICCRISQNNGGCNRCGCQNACNGCPQPFPPCPCLQPCPPCPQPCPRPQPLQLLITANPAAQTLLGGETLGLGQTVYSRGTALSHTDGADAVLVQEAGFYNVAVAFDYVTNTAGTMTFEILDYASSRFDVTAAADVPSRAENGATLYLPAGAALRLGYISSGSVGQLAVTNLVVSVEKTHCPVRGQNAE